MYNKWNGSRCSTRRPAARRQGLLFNSSFTFFIGSYHRDRGLTAGYTRADRAPFLLREVTGLGETPGARVDETAEGGDQDQRYDYEME